MVLGASLPYVLFLWQERCNELLPDPATPSPPPMLNYDVYTDIKLVENFLKHPSFHLVSSRKEADILWLAEHFKNFKWELREFVHVWWGFINGCGVASSYFVVVVAAPLSQVRWWTNFLVKTSSLVKTSLQLLLSEEVMGRHPTGFLSPLTFFTSCQSWCTSTWKERKGLSVTVCS